MPTPQNDFLPFAASNIANVETQATYATDAQRLNGNTNGAVASSALNNKALRQSSIFAAMLAQFIVDQTGANVVDDGTTATIEANFEAALGKALPGRLLGITMLTAATNTFVPNPLATKTIIEAQADGGAGGGVLATSASTAAASVGGACGAYAKVEFNFPLPSSLAVNIGQGGTPAAGTHGGDGAGITIGGILTVPGGQGGTGGPAVAPPYINQQLVFSPLAPTTTGTFIAQMSTALGGPGRVLGLTATQIEAGGGSQSFYGHPASGYGAGGAGIAAVASSPATQGSQGRPGIVIIMEFA